MCACHGPAPDPTNRQHPFATCFTRSTRPAGGRQKTTHWQTTRTPPGAALFHAVGKNIVFGTRPAVFGTWTATEQKTRSGLARISRPRVRAPIDAPVCVNFPGDTLATAQPHADPHARPSGGRADSGSDSRRLTFAMGTRVSRQRGGFIPCPCRPTGLLDGEVGGRDVRIAPPRTGHVRGRLRHYESSPALRSLASSNSSRNNKARAVASFVTTPPSSSAAAFPTDTADQT